jgi:hypothetical protein
VITGLMFWPKNKDFKYYDEFESLLFYKTPQPLVNGFRFKFPNFERNLKKIKENNRLFFGICYLFILCKGKEYCGT